MDPEAFGSAGLRHPGEKPGRPGANRGGGFDLPPKKGDAEAIPSKAKQFMGMHAFEEEPVKKKQKTEKRKDNPRQKVEMAVCFSLRCRIPLSHLVAPRMCYLLFFLLPPQKRDVKARPGESFKQYARRVKLMVRQTLQESDKSIRKTSEKRKAHLEKRDQHKKEKKQKKNPSSASAQHDKQAHPRKDADSDDEEILLSRDHVAFGDRVEAPPKLSYKPIPPKNAPQAIVGSEEGDHGTKQSKYDEMEALRAKVQTAYKAMKYRKADSNRKATLMARESQTDKKLSSSSSSGSQPKHFGFAFDSAL